MLYLIESIEDRNVLVDSVTLEMKGVTRKQLLDMVREGTNIGNIDGKLLLDNPECKFLISAYKPATSMCLERLPEKLLYTFCRDCTRKRTYLQVPSMIIYSH